MAGNAKGNIIPKDTLNALKKIAFFIELKHVVHKYVEADANNKTHDKEKASKRMEKIQREIAEAKLLNEDDLRIVDEIFQEKGIFLNEEAYNSFIHSSFLKK